MVAQGFDHLREHRQARRGSRGAEPVPVGQLAPHQQAGLVGGVEIRLVGDGDVAAQEVETQLPHLRDLVIEECARRRGRARVRVVVLVEGAEQVHRLPVEHHAPVARAHVAHPERRRQQVRRAAVSTDEACLYAVERRGSQPPRHRIGDLEVDRSPVARGDAVAGPARHAPAAGIEDLDREPVGDLGCSGVVRRPVHRPADARPAARQVGADGERPEMHPGTTLEGHGSDEPAGRRVPGLLAAGGRRELLAEQRRGGVDRPGLAVDRLPVEHAERVADADGEVVGGAGPDMRREVDLERQVAALVAADRRAVEVDGRSSPSRRRSAARRRRRPTRVGSRGAARTTRSRGHQRRRCGPPRRRARRWRRRAAGPRA